MKRRISHALAMRSTWMFLRVTQVRPWKSARSGFAGLSAGFFFAPERRRFSSAATADSAGSRPGAPKKSIATISVMRFLRRARSESASGRRSSSCASFDGRYLFSGRAYAAPPWGPAERVAWRSRDVMLVS